MASSPQPPSPSQTFHPSILPLALPTPALVDSVAGAAHYSGANIDPDTSTTTMRLRHTSNPPTRHSSHTELKPGHYQVIADLNELFACKPNLEVFDRRWRRDAVFEDPLSKCQGFDEYAAQWYALAKLCSKSETVRHRVMSSTNSPNRLVYAQAQEYTFRLFGHKKLIESIVIVDLDDDDKIVRLIDQWGGKELPTRYGALFLRWVNAKVTPWLVRVPK